MIVRDSSRLDAAIRVRVQVVRGSHHDPAVLDEALTGVDSLFWLVPPGVDGTNGETRYLGFARPAAEAIRRHGVTHVVGISSAGHGWPGRAGMLSAAFAMDAEIESSGAAYRALSMPFFMENLLRQLDSIRNHGAFSLANTADRTLATVASGDIAATAAGLLADRSWRGQQNLPVFGRDRLSPKRDGPGALRRARTECGLPAADPRRCRVGSNPAGRERGGRARRDGSDHRGKRRDLRR